MELTEAEYLAIYNRAYRAPVGKRTGEKIRDTLFSKLMGEARAKKRASRASVAPHKCRIERHREKIEGVMMTVEVRK